MIVKEVVCVILLAVTIVTSSDMPPNIVLIIADDLGWNDVGWNNPDMITPKMNKLAEKGVILDNLYVQNTCSPTRAAVLTGYYPYHMGLQHLVISEDFPKYIPGNIPVIAEKLRELNYKTHLVGKWHVGDCNIKYTLTRRGFDSFMGFYSGAIDYYNRTVVAPIAFEDIVGKYDFRRGTRVYFPKKEYVTSIFGRRAVEIIRKHDRQQPLFLELSFSSPHSPLQVPRKSENLYKCVTGMVTSMDVEIGNVVKALETHNMMKNTLIFFMSDNGGANNAAGNNLPYRGDKSTLWEGAMKSAAFVYSKTLLAKTGYRNSKIMHVVDLFPTFLAMAGGTPDPKIDGKNQWPALSSDAESARNEFVYNIDEIDENAAIRVGDLKLIVGPPSTIRNDAFYQLHPNSCRNRPTKHWSAKLNQRRHSYVHNKKIATERSGGKQHTVDNCGKGGQTVMYRLYNITGDPEEKFNLACHFPELLQHMINRLDFFNESYVTVQEFTNTEDFGKPYINDVISHRWC